MCDDERTLEKLEVLKFSGLPSEDVTEFLGAVKRVAIARGRQKDHEWITDYTESCLRGNAMKWFDGASVTDPSQFSTWPSLRRAFLGRFELSGPPQAPAAVASAAWTPPPEPVSNAPLPSSIIPNPTRSVAKAS
ncbi:hypothetical protein FRB96_002930 [Tulasnella sp. 330]|nr:hypothetical protein FRB96_002930 [Tulasnella sp. 330]KAG8874211.1 hypothetical protein FRB97_006073 [Tulasnella sp. 331]